MPPQSNLQTLIQMGVERNMAAFALRECAHDIDHAVQYLLALQSAQMMHISARCYCGDALATATWTQNEEYSCRCCWAPMQRHREFMYCRGEQQCIFTQTTSCNYAVCSVCSTAPSPTAQTESEPENEHSFLFSKLAVSIDRISYFFMFSEQCGVIHLPHSGQQFEATSVQEKKQYLAKVQCDFFEDWLSPRMFCVFTPSQTPNHRYVQAAKRCLANQISTSQSWRNIKRFTRVGYLRCAWPSTRRSWL